MYFKINSFFRKEHNQYINLRNKTIRMLCGYEAFEDVEDTELAWTDDQILNRIQSLVDYRHREYLRQPTEPDVGTTSQEKVRERLDKWRRWALNNVS
jgi:phenylpropionate dioxygenase-like ring-hydroxylating dioxygenase large terminal subunit